MYTEILWRLFCPTKQYYGDLILLVLVTRNVKELWWALLKNSWSPFFSLLLVLSHSTLCLLRTSLGGCCILCELTESRILSSAFWALFLPDIFHTLFTVTEINDLWGPCHSSISLTDDLNDAAKKLVRPVYVVFYAANQHHQISKGQNSS